MSASSTSRDTAPHHLSLLFSASGSLVLHASAPVLQHGVMFRSPAAAAAARAPAAVVPEERGVGAAVGDHVPTSVRARDGAVHPQPACARCRFQMGGSARVASRTVHLSQGLRRDLSSKTVPVCDVVRERPARLPAAKINCKR